MSVTTALTGTTPVNALDTDFKAEVVAAALLEYHVAAERLFVRRLGSNSRARSKDILQ